MRSWSVLLTSVFVFSLQLGCDRPRADGQEREGAPAPSAPAKVVAKAPTPPPPFIEGNWIAQSSLEQVSLGGPTKKKKGSSADENPVAREPTRATGSVSISPRGDL